MLIPSNPSASRVAFASLSRRVNANSQQLSIMEPVTHKLIKKGEC